MIQIRTEHGALLKTTKRKEFIEMNNLAKPHNTYKKGDKVICRAVTVYPAPPNGYEIEEHYGSEGSVVEKWSTGDLTIDSVNPQLWEATGKAGYLILIRDVRGYHYYPGYDIAFCLINEPRLVDKRWFKNGVNVGFWGTRLTRIKDSELCVAVLSMKGEKLVCELKPLGDKFDNKHRIIVAG